MDSSPAAPAAPGAKPVFAPGPATPDSGAASGSGGGIGIVAIVTILLIVCVIGVLAYLIYDYFTYKKAALAEADKDRKASLAHDRYIIDKTNAISGTLNSNVLNVNSKADYLRAGFNSWNDDFSKALRFTSNIPSGSAGASTGGAAAGGAAAGPDAASGAFRIGQVPGAPIANLELLKHTSFVGGLTARELTSERAAALCGSGANSDRCIRFPDADGNTYLTGLTPEASVVLDAAKTKVLGSLDFGKIGSIGDQDGNLHIGGPAVSLGNYYAPNGIESAEINVFGLDERSGLMYASKKADEALDPRALIKLATTRDGGLLINGKGIVLMSNSEPYAMIGYDAKTKGVVVAAGPGGKVIVQGDVIMADRENVFATLSREYGKDGAANGLRVSSVAANRLLLDTDVYLGDGRTLYGKTEATASVAKAATPAPAPTPVPGIITGYYAILNEVRRTLIQNRAEFAALVSLPEEIFNYQKDPTAFFAKYPFMDVIMNLVTYKGTAEFAAFSQADVVETETAIGYFTDAAFSVEGPNGRYHISSVLDASIKQFYLNNRDVLNARYGYPAR